jgi:predicted nucleic acid-binding protein
MYTVDASVWINAVEPAEPDHAASRQFLGLLRSRSDAVVVPTLALVEVAGAASRLRDPERARRLVRIVARLHVAQWIPLDGALAAAAQLAATHRLRGADAVYAAVAQRADAVLVSHDHEHLTRLAGIIPVLHPAGALAALMRAP